MDKMEKRIFAFFGQEDRTQTLALLIEYLGLTKDPARQDAILNAIPLCRLRAASPIRLRADALAQ